MSRQLECLAKAAAAEAMAAGVGDFVTRQAMRQVAESWRLLASGETAIAGDVERIVAPRPRTPRR